MIVRTLAYVTLWSGAMISHAFNCAAPVAVFVVGMLALIVACLRD